jgi:tetratricopeptide (TPR) repeat protein
VHEASDKPLLEPVQHRMQYRLNWKIYDKESGNTFHKERLYGQPRAAFASFNWARTEKHCVSAEVYRRGTPEHSWVMLASFGNRPLRAAIRTDTLAAAAYDPIMCVQVTIDEAIAASTRKQAFEPNDPFTYGDRGNAYARKGDYDRAIADYDEAIRLDPKYALGYNYYNRGNAYNRKGDYDRAIADYDQAIRLYPKHAKAYNNRGEAYEAKNDLDHAIADYDQALKLAPSLAEARQGLERLRGPLTKRR